MYSKEFWNNNQALHILSKQTSRSFSSTTSYPSCGDNDTDTSDNSTIIPLNALIKLDPWFVTGFCDGEACVTLDVSKRNDSRLGWTVKPIFQITLHVKDVKLLECLKFFWNAGNISIHKEFCRYYCSSIKELNKIIEHFDNYPLITKKQVDYLLFKQAISLIISKKHLTSGWIKKKSSR